MPTVVRVNSCLSGGSLLNWLQIIVASIVLGLILWGNRNYTFLKHGEEYVIFVASFVIALNLLFLFILCTSVYNGRFAGCDWLSMVTAYYFLCIVMWLIAGGVEIYATLYFRNKNQEHYARRAAAAALCFFNGLLFISSLQHVRVNTNVVFVSI